MKTVDQLLERLSDAHVQERTLWEASNAATAAWSEMHQLVIKLKKETTAALLSDELIDLENPQLQAAVLKASTTKVPEIPARKQEDIPF